MILDEHSMLFMEVDQNPLNFPSDPSAARTSVAAEAAQPSCAQPSTRPRLNIGVRVAYGQKTSADSQERESGLREPDELN